MSPNKQGGIGNDRKEKIFDINCRKGCRIKELFDGYFVFEVFGYCSERREGSFRDSFAGEDFCDTYRDHDSYNRWF